MLTVYFKSECQMPVVFNFDTNIIVVIVIITLGVMILRQSNYVFTVSLQNVKSKQDC